MKKILIIGGTGTIGKAVCDAFDSLGHLLITAGYNQGDHQVDIGDPDSIKTMYKKVGNIDAVICAAARGVTFKPIDQISINEITTSMHSKLFGQINVVLEGIKWVNDNGSITLTTGILNREPIITGAAAAIANGGIDSFVKAAALEMPRMLKINAVSPGLLTESKDKYEKLFPGYATVNGSKVALAYVRSVTGGHSGRVFCVD